MIVSKASARFFRSWALGVASLAFATYPARAQDFPRYPAAGSTYVPLDSWVYPVFDRLSGQGYIQSAIFGLKPWARTECARLTEEARDVLEARITGDKHVEEQAAEMVDALEKEFAPELRALGGDRNRSLALESLYTRVLSISGPPLTDGYHFGQTVAYDFGRPFRRGTNVIAGGAARATYGPVAVHLGAEFQHSPSAPPLSDAVLDLIAVLDLKPREAPRPFATVNRPRWMETYVTINVRNWQFSVGNQNLNWGVGSGESLILSHNAEPMPMIRLTRIMPHKLPSLFRLLGPIRSEFFATRLEGSTFVPRPFLYGNKISFKPHPRFELTFSRTTLIGGGSFPLTTRAFLKSLIGKPDPSLAGSKPGDSRTAMDLAFQIASSLYFYAELYEDDEPIFFHNPSRGAYRPGIYISRMPGAARIDLRIEAASTMSAAPLVHVPGLQSYWNFQYRDGYTYNGFLLGNSIGRAGRSLKVVSNYWFSPREFLRLTFRQNQTQSGYISGGGTSRDCSVEYSRVLKRGMYLKSSLQLETISGFQILDKGARSNVAAILEFSYHGGR